MKQLSDLLFMAPLLLFALPCLAATTSCPWEDTYYQYRIPVTLEFAEAGWHVIPITEQHITVAVNELEAFKYRDRSFAYNYLKCVEVDEAGNAVDTDMEVGFYLVETGPDLTGNWTEGLTPTNDAAAFFEAEDGVEPPVCKGDELTIVVEPGAKYLLRYTSSGGAGSPAYKYEAIYPEGSARNKHHYRVSYEPRLLRLAETTYENLMQPGIDSMTLVVGGRWVNTPKRMSLRKAKILLLANVKSPGKKDWHIYYQPMGSHFLMVPERRHEAVPAAMAQMVSQGKACKYEGRTRHGLAAHTKADLWFAESTVKLTPSTPPPEPVDPMVRISCARNERQSFQLVVTPRHAINFTGISITDLSMVPGSRGRLPSIELRAGDREGERLREPQPEVRMIPAGQIAIKAIEYVPVRQTSFITPTDYRGWVGDPLVPVEPKLLMRNAGNLGFWVTIDVAPQTAPGIYRGRIHVEGEDERLFDVGIELTVRSFALPEYAPLQTHFGGQYFVKPCVFPKDDGDPKRLIEYYGVKTHEDLRKLTRGIYTEMVRNKFTPKNAAMYTPIGMNWDPPPKGFNVDEPDNFFRLYDWDFAAFNEEMRHFIDELKMNQICIYHTNPKALNLFMHLPGKDLTEYPDSSPFVAYAWQSFRGMTIVGYDIDEKHSYRKLAKDITRDQYDRLVLDFFRAMAANLEAHGWLHFATIMIDETHHDRFLLHFLNLLKSDPLTARIKVGTCVQGLSYFTDPKFNGLLDYYVPEIDENYNRWEPYYFSDYGIDPSKLWQYVVTGARFAIDAPGINNREIGLDLWQRGANGYLCWETFLHTHTRGDWGGRIVRNIWTDPFTTFANGALSFLYPPRRDGSLPTEPDFTVTTSLRMEAHREAFDDYEYAWLLDNAMKKAEKTGRDVSKAKAIFADIRRFFHNSNLWSQNDAWFLELRERMAEEIEELIR